MSAEPVRKTTAVVGADLGAPDVGPHHEPSSSSSGPASAPEQGAAGGGPPYGWATNPVGSHRQPSVQGHAAGGRLPAGPGAAPHAPGSAFAFDITRDMGVVVVTAHGRLDATSGAALRAVLVDLIEGQGNLRLVVDLHDAPVVDPSIVRVLVAASASAARRGGELTFADPSDALLAALEAVGLTRAVTLNGYRRLRSLASLSPVAAESEPRRTARAQHPAGTDGGVSHPRSTTTRGADQ